MASRQIELRSKKLEGQTLLSVSCSTKSSAPVRSRPGRQGLEFGNSSIWFALTRGGGMITRPNMECFLLKEVMQVKTRLLLLVVLTCVAMAGCVTSTAPGGAETKGTELEPSTILGLTGRVSSVCIAKPAATRISPLAATPPPADVDLKRMAEWAMNYLILTPRKELGYEPVFQCYPLNCPPIPASNDPVVSCDTDARMDWQWYFMREVSGSTQGKDVEAAFHKRMRDYIGPDGRVWGTPGAYNEGDTQARYGEDDRIYHIWGATKILESLSLDYARIGNLESKALARKVMLALKKVAVWDGEGRCYFPCGMGALRPDGSVVPNGWNAEPAPIVEPLVTYWLVTQDAEGLEFARAYSEGIMNNLQPDGLRFLPDGSFPGGHSHATLHAIWGVAHLGVVTGERKYLDFAERSWKWMLSRGAGTGWFPALPDSCNETCCLADMMSIAALLGQAGKTEYYDYVERYLRNYISPLQFIITPEFEAYYRSLNASAKPQDVEQSLRTLRRFQGGIIGGSGLNDYENELLGRVSGYAMFGCCAPSGMNAIYTAWSNEIDCLPASPLGPAGVYVNMSLGRDSQWGRVVSFFPEQGRLTVVTTTTNAYFLRPPHWAPRDQIHAFVGTRPVPVRWSGDHVRFDAAPGQEITITYPLVRFTHEVEGLWKVSAPELKMRFEWLGDMVVSVAPPATLTPLFTGKPRILPPPPSLDQDYVDQLTSGSDN